MKGKLMAAMNSEIKKIVSRVKDAQIQLQSLLSDKTWIEDARKYAEKQKKEVRKLLRADVGKVLSFLERERKELERFQKQIPGEFKKFRKFVTGQRKEFERLLKSVRRVGSKPSEAPKASKAPARRKSGKGASAPKA